MQKWTVCSSVRETVAYDRGLNLDDLLFHYGVRINQDLVEDMQCASINLVVGSQGGKPQFQLTALALLSIVGWKPCFTDH